MKLFLTSTGFTNKKIAHTFLQCLNLPIAENRILIVAYAKNAKEEFYVEESKKEIQGLGFVDIIVLNMNSTFDIRTIGDFDVIYVCGGNTFSILDKMRQMGIDRIIIDQVKRGAIYVGVSAGSIMVGPSIEIAGWGTEGDDNEIGLQDLVGFCLVNLAIFPHYHQALSSEVVDFKKRVEYPVIALTNDQAVYVNSGTIEIIGN